MKIKCDKCEKSATIHLTEISESGEKVERHLCEQCAVTEGLAFKSEIPIKQLLEDFIKQADDAYEELTCDVCGMNFSEFNRTGRLGCPNDYEAFGQPLVEILERSHENMAQHFGKVPHRAATSQKKQASILRLRSRLTDAVSAEDYEQAAALRDQIKELEP